MLGVISQHSRRVSGGTTAAGKTFELAAWEVRKAGARTVMGKRRTTRIHLKKHAAKSF
jgi:hypothetical protein